MTVPGKGGAPKGNKNAVGHGEGRPLAYKTPGELQKAVDKYFNSCQAQAKDKDGNLEYGKDGEPIYIFIKPLTITGLALSLGFTSRQSLLNYQERVDFVDIITRAKLQIEDYLATASMDNKAFQGCKLNLTANFGGYADKQEVDLSGGITIKMEGDSADYGK